MHWADILIKVGESFDHGVIEIKNYLLFGKPLIGILASNIVVSVIIR